MSITNFEILTENLTDNELKHEKSMKGIMQHIMDEKGFLKAPELCNLINYELANFYSITPISLRRWCNHFRSNSILPIIATSKGYCLSNDKAMIESQIKSLRERANSINQAAIGLELFLR